MVQGDSLSPKADWRTQIAHPALHFSQCRRIRAPDRADLGGVACNAARPLTGLHSDIKWLYLPGWGRSSCGAVGKGKPAVIDAAMHGGWVPIGQINKRIAPAHTVPVNPVGAVRCNDRILQPAVRPAPVLRTVCRKAVVPSQSPDPFIVSVWAQAVGHGAVADGPRCGAVVVRDDIREEIKALEDKSDLLVPYVGEPVVVELGDVSSAKKYSPRRARRGTP